MDVTPYSPELLEKWDAVISTVRGISEWTGDREIAWLCEQAKGRDIVEVGSYKGKSSKAMLLAGARNMTCVDNFQDDTMEEVEFNLKDYIENESLEIVPLESEVAADYLTGTSAFTMAFIDASHTEADVARDIALWEPLVVKGGLMCFHDCHAHERGGPYDAVMKHRPDAKVAVDSILYYTV